MLTIINEVSELQKLVSEFNDFARLPALKKEEFDLCELIEGVVSIYRGSHPHIEFRVSCNDGMTINADRMQIRRVFMNLFSNSIHAMGDKGILTIEVKNMKQFTRFL